MKIQVTQDHIDAAKYMSEIDWSIRGMSTEECCPIGLALKTQGFPWALVNGQSIKFYGMSKRSVRMPIWMGNFVWYFDMRRLMKPFEFTYHDGKITGYRYI